MRRNYSMFLTAPSNRGIAVEVFVDIFDAVEDLIGLPNKMFRPPSIRAFAVDCKPENVVKWEVRVKFRVLARVPGPVPVGDATVILSCFLSKELWNIFVPIAIVNVTLVALGVRFQVAFHHL